jgi:membrane protease YdiL (CAAX protease family)
VGILNRALFGFVFSLDRAAKGCRLNAGDRPLPDDVPYAEPAVPDADLAEPVEAAERRPLLPAPARLAIYVASVVVTALVGGIAVVIAALPFVGGDIKALEHSLTFTLASMWATYLPIAAVTLLFVAFIDRRNMTEFGLAILPRTGKDVLLGVVLGAVPYLALVAFGLPLGWIEIGPPTLTPEARQSIFRVLAVGLAAFVVNGSVEEMVFRGYLLPNTAVCTSRWIAIISTSILFALMHLANPGGRELGTQFSLWVCGVTMSLAYIGTRSLWLPMAWHVTNNFIGVSILVPSTEEGLNFPCLLNTRVTAPDWLVGQAWHVGAFDIATQLVVTGIVYLWIYRPGIQARSPNDAAANCYHR